jgi:vacuolar-type H+-ATPase subunit I/STV1
MKWLRYVISLLLIGAFLSVTWVFRPENPEKVGGTILLVLGILAVVGILMGGIYLYSRHRKFSLPHLNGAGKFLGKVAGRDKLGTALLVGLFLLTLSYVIGGREEWKDSLRWWWNSKIFLPSLLAVIGVILFVDAKWRKKINNALIFTTGALILFSLIVATPMTKDLLKGGDDKNKTSSSTPQKKKVTAVEVEKTKKETVLAQYGTFTEVSLPPTEKLINVSWKFPSKYNGRCLAVIVHESRPDGEVFPCESPVHGLLKVRRVGFSSDDPLEGVPVTVETTYRETEYK